MISEHTRGKRLSPATRHQPVCSTSKANVVRDVHANRSRTRAGPRCRGRLSLPRKATVCSGFKSLPNQVGHPPIVRKSRPRLERLIRDNLICSINLNSSVLVFCSLVLELHLVSCPPNNTPPPLNLWPLYHGS